MNATLRATLVWLPFLLLLGFSAPAQADTAAAFAVVYDVDFASPAHEVGSAPSVGVSDTPRAMPTAIRRHPALVVEQYGALTDQPLAFPGPRRGDVEFSLQGLPACPGYTLSMNVVVDSELTLLLSAPFVNLVRFQPNGDVVVSIRDLATNTQSNTVVATYQPGDGAVHELSLDLDFVADSFDLALDGQVVHSTGFGGQILLSQFRLLGTRCAVDDVLLTYGTEVTVLEAVVDVRPGSGDPAPVNLASKGVLPVALLSTADLDAADVDTDSLTISDSAGGDGAAPLRTALEDLDGDGVDDLILHFSMRELVPAGVLSASTTSLTLSGQTLDGAPLTGRDRVRVLVKRKR